MMPSPWLRQLLRQIQRKRIYQSTLKRFSIKNTARRGTAQLVAISELSLPTSRSISYSFISERLLYVCTKREGGNRRLIYISYPLQDFGYVCDCYPSQRSSIPCQMNTILVFHVRWIQSWDDAVDVVDRSYFSHLYIYIEKLNMVILLLLIDEKGVQVSKLKSPYSIVLLVAYQWYTLHKQHASHGKVPFCMKSDQVSLFSIGRREFVYQIAKADATLIPLSTSLAIVLDVLILLVPFLVVMASPFQGLLPSFSEHPTQ